jgi:threonyl-tRNA synthetase
MAVVGKAEFENGTLNVRTRAQGELGELSLEALMGRMAAAVAEKSVL